jgi:hypothetical protein
LIWDENAEDDPEGNETMCLGSLCLFSGTKGKSLETQLKAMEQGAASSAVGSGINEENMAPVETEKGGMMFGKRLNEASQVELDQQTGQMRGAVEDLMKELIGGACSGQEKLLGVVYEALCEQLPNVCDEMREDFRMERRQTFDLNMEIVEIQRETEKEIHKFEMNERRESDRRIEKYREGKYEMAVQQENKAKDKRNRMFREDQARVRMQSRCDREAWKDRTKAKMDKLKEEQAQEVNGRIEKLTTATMFMTTARTTNQLLHEVLDCSPHLPCLLIQLHLTCLIEPLAKHHSSLLCFDRRHVLFIDT